jgi:Transposase DDE domain
MTNLTQLAETMQALLTTEADELARRTGFIIRQRKVSGSNFAQTVVFSALTAPDAPQSRRLNTAATVGLLITAKGLEKRFDARGAAFLRAMLQAAVSQAIAAPVAIPLLQRFTAVDVLDGSTIALPDALAPLFRGGRSGTTTGAKAAVKITVGLDLVSGRLSGPELSDGRAADLRAALAVADPPAGALHLADLNYFSLEEFARWGAGGAYWLSRLKSGTAVYDAAGRRLDLVAFLRAAGAADVDRDVVLGSQRRVPCRLIARRVPAAVAAQRRQRLLDKSKRRGDKPSALSLALCEWTLLVTNVPRDRLTVEEAIALGRMRWQIELVFKLWKSQGGIDAWCGDDPDAALCQVYGKLLAQVVQHWVIVAGAWSLVDRSLTKAAGVVQDLALSLAAALRSVRRLRAVLAQARTLMGIVARMERRKKRLSAHAMILCLGSEP